MSAPNWNCWIGDEDGGSQVFFNGAEQPDPIPLPRAPIKQTVHELIKPGYQVNQNAGFGQETLTINLSIPVDKWFLIDTLLKRRDANGNALPVRFSNSYHVYKCKPGGDLNPDLPKKRAAMVKVQFVLSIVETIL